MVGVADDVAPFTLMPYDDAITYSDDIKQALKNRTMPPWKPVPGFNEFRDSFAITDDERNTILAWIDGGTVAWGERTSDEMCVALVGVIFDSEGNLPLPFSVSSR